VPPHCLTSLTRLSIDPAHERSRGEQSPQKYSDKKNRVGRGGRGGRSSDGRALRHEATAAAAEAAAVAAFVSSSAKPWLKAVLASIRTRSSPRATLLEKALSLTRRRFILTHGSSAAVSSSHPTLQRHCDSACLLLIRRRFPRSLQLLRWVPQVPFHRFQLSLKPFLPQCPPSLCSGSRHSAQYVNSQPRLSRTCFLIGLGRFRGGYSEI
jgi:hypothetical protein